MDIYFHRCSCFKIKLKITKCEFWLKSLEWCGHLVSEKGISIAPSKLKALDTVPVPENGGELMQFICSINFLRNKLPLFTDPDTQEGRKIAIFASFFGDFRHGRHVALRLRLSRPGGLWTRAKMLLKGHGLKAMSNLRRYRQNWKSITHSLRIMAFQIYSVRCTLEDYTQPSNNGLLNPFCTVKDYT